MICFDTNVLIGDVGTRQQALLALLRGLAHVTGYPLALPQTVFEELMGRYERAVTDACAMVERIEERRQLGKPARDGQVERLEEARSTLLDLVPWWVYRPEFYRGDNTGLPLINSAVRREEERLRRIFRILPRPLGADEEGNQREVKRQLPALHDGTSSKGSRDTAIWLTVLEAARQAGHNLIFFISRDGGFASKGGRRVLHSELRAEAVQARAANLVFYSDVDQLIDRLSCVAPLPEPVETLIASAPVEAAVRARLQEGDFGVDLSGWREELGRAFLTTPDKLIPQPRRDESRVCRVGETTLVATNRIWHVERRYRVLVPDRGLSDERTDEATAIVSTLQGLPRYPRPAARTETEPEALPLVAWNSIIDLAQHQQIAVWSDDPIQRARARQAGLSATSTPAIVDYLAHTGQISSGQHEEAIRQLIKARVGDFPLNEHRLLELAEDDNWVPGCIAAALSRPAAWSDLPRAATFLNQLITIIRHRRHETIPYWLHGVTRAAAASIGTNSAAASDVAARLLTITIHAARAQAPMVADLVTAARSALAEADDPDHPPSPDPLQASALLLRDAYAKVIAPSLATSYVLSAFASLPEQDQRAVRLALLG